MSSASKATTLDMGNRIPDRVGLQQRVLPNYRVGFVELLAERLGGKLSVFAGQPRAEEEIRTAEDFTNAEFILASNLHILSGSLYLCLQRGLQAWLDQLDPEVLVLEANPRYLSNPGGIKWMHQRGRPVIGWGLGASEPEGLLSRWSESFRKRYLHSFDALIAYSTKGADQYRKIGFPPERIFVALNSAAPAPDAMPERAAIANGPPRLIFVGRLQARKRVDLLLRACAAIQPQPELWIVGEGPEKDRLIALAGRVFPQAQFLGQIFGNDLHERLRQADLFVLPGTGGLALQEAMANGLPLIAAEGDGTQEDLVHAQNGWLVHPGNQAQLTAVLQEALQDRAGLRRMGAASFEIVRTKANIEAMADVFLEAIAKATAEN